MKVKILLLCFLIGSCFSTLKIADKYTVDMRVIDSDTLEVTVVADPGTWLVLGVGTHAMKDVDFWYFTFIPGTQGLVQVEDRWSVDYSDTIPIDESMDLILKSSSYNSGKVTTIVHRKLDTGDNMDWKIVKGQEIKCGFSWGEGVVTYHSSQFGFWFLTVNTDNTISLVWGGLNHPKNIPHSAIMTIVWILLNISGLMAITTFKHWVYSYFIHSACGYASTLTTIITGLSLISEVGNKDGIIDAHNIIGVIMIIISFFQIITGPAIMIILMYTSFKSDLIHRLKFGHRIIGIVGTWLVLLM